MMGPLGKSVEYKKAGDIPLHLYIESPTDGAKVHPAILFFHGGAWTMGGMSQFNTQSVYLAGRGMVAIEVQYRLLSKDSTDPPKICAEDAKSAMRWVRSHAKELGVDPNRIVAAGASAGGYLALFDAMIPGWDDPGDDLSISPRPNALVLLFPVVDIGPNGFGYKRFGPDYAKYAPITYVSKDTPPILIQGGLADKLVSPQSLRDFQAAVRKTGGRCELIFYEDQPHSFSNREPYTTITLKAAAKFLESVGYLKPEPEIPAPAPAP